MLDDSSPVTKKLSAVKQKLHAALQNDGPADVEALQQLLVPTRAPQLLRTLGTTGKPLERLRALHGALKALVRYVGSLCEKLGSTLVVYHGESLFMLIR